ncbi:MAG: proline iminopeptidase-family hydrolase [Candidatus Eisenbacteria sp.]|nr:proline iminopeptidase-family hydrolase [Candidatus Eisenbacteria bacterium]
MKEYRIWFLILLSSLIVNCVLAQQESELPASQEAREGFIAVDGGRVWYQIIGSGNAVPLLVLHGGPGVPHDYLEPLAGLADERPVVFYDQLGCGKSDRTQDSTLWTVERFVTEVAKVRAALELDRVHILGHSWGGTLAVDYLLTEPEGVESVILAGPYLSNRRWTEDQTRLLAAFPDSLRQVVARNEEAGTTDSEEYQAAVMAFWNRHICRLDPWPEYGLRALAGSGDDVYAFMWGASEFCCTGTLRSYERTDRLGEIAVPTLLTCGRYDETPPETVKWYQSLLPGSEMVVFEQSSHTPHMEEPDAYLKTVRDFINRVESR